MSLKKFDKKGFGGNKQGVDKTLIRAKQIILGIMVVMLIGYWGVPRFFSLSNEEEFTVGENVGVEIKKSEGTSDKGDKEDAGTAGGKIEIVPDEGAVSSAGDYFANYKLERDRIRGEQLEILREIVNNNGSDNSSRKSASEKMIAITESLEKEMMLENLMEGKGITHVAVFLDGSRLNIVLGEQAEKTTEQEVAKIAALSSEHTGLPLENIFITVK